MGNFFTTDSTTSSKEPIKLSIDPVNVKLSHLEPRDTSNLAWYEIPENSKSSPKFAIVVENVLTREGYIFCKFNYIHLQTLECQKWIEETEASGGYSAALLNNSLATNFRKSSRCLVDDPQVAGELWERIKSFIPKQLNSSKQLAQSDAIGLYQKMRFLRYKTGEYFAPHYDGRFVVPTEEPNAGDTSFITFQLYLNDGFEGGSTRFFGPDYHFNDDDPSISQPAKPDEFDVVPKAGSVLLFEQRLMHSGEVITKGVKYAMRVDMMFRERPSETQTPPPPSSLSTSS